MCDSPCRRNTQTYLQHIMSVSFPCTYCIEMHGIETRQHRVSGGQQNNPWRSCPLKDWSWLFPSDSLSMTGDFNHRNTGEPPITMAWKRERGGGGQELERWWKWGKGWEKCSLWFALVCLANCLQWAAFVQWPMQLEWRLLSKSSCRAPDKRIKNYDIF